MLKTLHQQPFQLHLVPVGESFRSLEGQFRGNQERHDRGKPPLSGKTSFLDGLLGRRAGYRSGRGILEVLVSGPSQTYHDAPPSINLMLAW